MECDEQIIGVIMDQVAITLTREQWNTVAACLYAEAQRVKNQIPDGQLSREEEIAQIIVQCADL
jgi:hypothetical protein